MTAGRSVFGGVVPLLTFRYIISNFVTNAFVLADQKRSYRIRDLKEEAFLMLAPLMYSSAPLVGNLLGFTGVVNLVNLVFMDIYADSV